jgi:molecular chaperone IbpA
LSKSTNSNYPHYNILKLDENNYRISLALAGFSKNNVEILLEENILVIRSILAPNLDKNEYLYKGIANRAFQKKFQLAENVKVDNAFFENGLLNIDLLKFKPARTKVMRINIQSNN